MVKDCGCDDLGLSFTITKGNLKMEIREGSRSKGGVNHWPPKTKRPSPPKGQGGKRSEENCYVCGRRQTPNSRNE
jgi:hypothetical protein